MPKFIVNIKEVHNLAVEVFAATPEAAREIVNDMLAHDDGSIDFDALSYSHTMPMDNWTVEPK